MKKIEINEQKQIMIEILEYFDKICRLNNIKYSLIGGSLIGAIRHKGIIPWDDDIDVILTKENYDKIIEVLKNDKSSRFKLLFGDIQKDYYYPFPKLVDTRTYVVEPLSLKQINEYGIYIDIFCYNYVSNDEKVRNQTVKKIKFWNGLISRKKVGIKNKKFLMNLARNIISSIIGSKKLIKIVNKIYEDNKNLNSKFVISNWPIYANEKEIQLSKNVTSYVDMPFENINAMIFKNYDKILNTTFGDYMKLPPINERKCHGLIAYWRDDENEKEIKK